MSERQLLYTISTGSLLKQWEDSQRDGRYHSSASDHPSILSHESNAAVYLLNFSNDSMEHNISLIVVEDSLSKPRHPAIANLVHSSGLKYACHAVAAESVPSQGFNEADICPWRTPERACQRLEDVLPVLRRIYLIKSLPDTEMIAHLPQSELAEWVMWIWHELATGHTTDLEEFGRYLLEKLLSLQRWHCCDRAICGLVIRLLWCECPR